MKIVKNTINGDKFPVGTEVKWVYINGAYYLTVVDNKYAVIFGVTAKFPGSINPVAGKTKLIDDKRGILEIEL